MIQTGDQPFALALNPVINTIYVVNAGSSSVTMIDGMTRHTTMVLVGGQPYAIAINSNSFEAYVANSSSDSVTYIKGTQALKQIPTGRFL